MQHRLTHKTFFTGLDSLRLSAFLLVFLFHSIRDFNIGYTGVLFFFVISAFLLTFLAFEEISATGAFNPYRFFIRRALRIYPLYFGVVIFAFLLLPLLANSLHIPVTLPANQWLYFFFLSNYDYSDHVFFLKFLWSIAVEEQFYIGFALLAVLFKRNFLLIVTGFFLLYIAITLLNHIGRINLGYYNTLNYLPCFLTGMIIAKVHFSHPSVTKKLLWGLLVLGLLLVAGARFSPLVREFSNLTFAFFFGCLLCLVAVLQKRLHQLTKTYFRLPEFLGKLTYGLYVYSGLVLTVNLTLLKVKAPFIKQFMELSLIISLAYVSYRFFEKPLLNLKKKWY